MTVVVLKECDVVSEVEVALLYLALPSLPQMPVEYLMCFSCAVIVGFQIVSAQTLVMADDVMAVGIPILFENVETFEPILLFEKVEMSEALAMFENVEMSVTLGTNENVEILKKVMSENVEMSEILGMIEIAELSEALATSENTVVAEAYTIVVNVQVAEIVDEV
jgi:hypothetical protein